MPKQSKPDLMDYLIMALLLVAYLVSLALLPTVAVMVYWLFAGDWPPADVVWQATAGWYTFWLLSLLIFLSVTAEDED